METAPLEDIKGVITVRVSCNLMLPPNIKAKTEKLLYFLGISILPLMLLQHPCTIKLTRVIPICFLYYDRRKVVAHLKADTHTRTHSSIRIPRCRALAAGEQASRAEDETSY